MHQVRRGSPFILAIALAWMATGAAAQSDVQLADVVDNSPTDPKTTGVELLLPENAQIERLTDRISISIRIPTPVPGTYNYPEDVPAERQAAPEVFTGWVFIFNEPQNCRTDKKPPRCGPDDFTEAAQGGVYNFAGHITSVSHHGGAYVLDEGTGGYMVLTGEILVGQQQRPPLDATDVTYPLSDTAGAEIHVAIAPHGQVEPDSLPDELYRSAGTPGCDCWWLAMFLAPDSR